jgi:hypothetical protein
MADFHPLPNNVHAECVGMLHVLQLYATTVQGLAELVASGALNPAECQVALQAAELAYGECEESRDWVCDALAEACHGSAGEVLVVPGLTVGVLAPALTPPADPVAAQLHAQANSLTDQAADWLSSIVAALD